MKLTILLLNEDSDQDPQEGDLRPPSYDLLQRFLVTGSCNEVVLAHVPDEIDLVQRNRLSIEGHFYRIAEALPVYDGPPTHGVTRW